MKDLFASDYGVPSRELLSLKYVTNPTQCIRSKELYGVLGTCGTDADENGEKASDWELFSSFCAAAPLLKGHLVAARIALFLKELFGFEEEICAENAAHLWRTGVERLSREPLRTSSLLSKDTLVLCTEDDSALRGLGAPLLMDAARLLPRGGESFSLWRERIAATVEKEAALGCVGVLLRLPRGLCFFEPNPHSVGEALCQRRRDGAASDLILCQLLRELCVACVSNRLFLTVECASGAAAGELLHYARRTVGLPALCASAADAAQRDDLISLAKENDVRLALRISDMPTVEETEQALASIAARYPIGRVRLITGADLCQIGAAQSVAERIFCRALEKIG